MASAFASDEKSAQLKRGGDAVVALTTLGGAATMAITGDVDKAIDASTVESLFTGAFSRTLFTSIENAANALSDVLSLISPDDEQNQQQQGAQQQNQSQQQSEQDQQSDEETRCP